MKILCNTLITVVMAMVLFACDDENIQPQIKTDLIEIASEVDAVTNTKVRILAERNFFMGYHSFEVELTDLNSGKQLSGMDVDIMPMMNMSMHSHTSPYETLFDDQNDDGYYPFATVFIMAGNWELNVDFADGSGLNGSVQFQLPVEAAELTRVKTLTDLDGKMLFVSLISLNDPLVGQNEFEIAIHRRMDMMNFPGVTNCTVDIEPNMPSMGHGSPNNQAPIHVEKGHYMGSVNFTMDGDWVVDVSVLEGGTEIGMVQFDIAL